MPNLPGKFKNSLVRGDCLDVLTCLPDECVDFVYVDPPFCTGKNRKGENLPLAAGGRLRRGEDRQLFQYRDAWDGDLAGYLEWLRPRLDGMVRLLKPDGSMMVHLDGNASHYVKVILDEILGRPRFVNEIIWHYKTGGHPRKRLARKFDSILWYSRGGSFTYNPEAASLPRNLCRLCGSKDKRKNHMKREVDEEGRPVVLIKSAGKIYRYYEDAPAPPCDVWLDIGHLHQRDPERTGYPSQKPLKLLERIVAMCTKPGDVVADFFAGAGTTLVAAANLKRKWFGCDSSEEAARIVRDRFAGLSKPFRMSQWEKQKV